MNIFQRFFNWLIGLFKSKPSTPPVPIHTHKTPPNGLLIAYAFPWVIDTLTSGEMGGLSDVLKYNGINFTMVEWGPEPISVVKAFVETMRRNGIVTEISVVNGNDQENWGQPDAWYNARIDGLIKEIGVDHVIVMPMSEPRGSDENKVKRWIQYGITQWKKAGGKVVVNQNFRLSDDFIGQADYLEQHYCSDPNDSNMLNGKKYTASTDCGRTLSLGGDPTRIKTFIKSAIKHNCNAILYDAKLSGKPNWVALTAVGDAIEES